MSVLKKISERIQLSPSDLSCFRTYVPLVYLVEAGTSVGANYMEADGAESKKDFRHKIAICKKEAKETKHWLRMIRKANPQKAVECYKLWQEAHELTLIFSSILLPKKS